MLNFYSYYNKTGLDNEHYSSLIKQMIDGIYTSKLKPIEHLIKKDPCHAEQYAYWIMKCRWVEAEPVIIKDSWFAYRYALNVMKERWVEAEPIICDSIYWSYYCEAFNI